MVEFVCYVCSARSPQWLRGKWWSLKRHIPDYQLIPFHGKIMDTYFTVANSKTNAL